MNLKELIIKLLKIIDKKRVKKEKSVLKKNKKLENPLENKKKTVSQKAKIKKKPSIVNNSSSNFKDLVNKIINKNSIN